jgi:hypothetical protein
MTTSTLPDLEPEQAPAYEPAIASRKLPHEPVEELDPRHFDPTQGQKIGLEPYDDPTQGLRIGSHAYDDPTQGLQIASRPYDDATQGRELGSQPWEDPTRGR